MNAEIRSQNNQLQKVFWLNKESYIVLEQSNYFKEINISIKIQILIINRII